jgi:transposase
MDKARYLVEAHMREGRSVSELPAAHGVHRSWIYKLLARYREGGLDAVKARSRKPRSCAHQTPREVVPSDQQRRRVIDQERASSPGASPGPSCRRARSSEQGR